MDGSDSKFVEDFLNRMSRHRLVGPQGAANLKLDAWVLVIKHFLIKGGIVTNEEFDELLKQQLLDFERMVQEAETKLPPELQPTEGK